MIERQEAPSAVGRLNQHLSTLVAEQPSDPTLTPEKLEELNVMLFGRAIASTMPTGSSTRAPTAL